MVWLNIGELKPDHTAQYTGEAGLNGRSLKSE